MPSSWVEVGPGFWNLRAHFKILGGLLDLGTHMSLAKLSSGNFLVIDTVNLTPEGKAELDKLTDNGRLIEAVVATHPFHTLAFPSFYKAYPAPKYYGTPRHLRNIKEIPWAGDVNVATVRSQWEPDVYMRIPAGAEFVAPVPEKSNHFSNVFVFHKPSKTIHNDDTVLVSHNPPWILRLLGFKDGSMFFHPSLKGPGLYHTPEAPAQFRCWVKSIIEDWDFENLCTAHNGNQVGNAKKHLADALEKVNPTLEKLIKKYEKKTPRDENAGAWSTDQKDGVECG
mmetsp:Transcript_6163/g.10628  ORF Transcript_6163/g.10628 Transcript_6163/m.10628 type:complete len:282 (+) Transcript_6163:193-1038(+)|eukprot:CAMPEP_0196655922 /NCGR_PEP_ID=MMETSP1086-20130531/11298_1 /TAXON_ID=77921 /ORGANISM="Cyanoptyche  gloeocystis , Strain SAG4.97" /LENGTH=281 /DNA_ID=CAMNT_0041988469 /DNA_START=160 /DNA_END=1005 /DNA_ORIENTATION=+